MKPKSDLLDWLMAGDASIVWQVMRDIIDANNKEFSKIRCQIGKEGWGKKLLSFQDKNGLWSGELYNKKWISTVYSLYLLKKFGFLPNEKTYFSCKQLFDGGIFNNEEIRFSRNQKLRDNGVTGLVLGLMCYFNLNDDRIHNIAEYLSSSQNKNGSWYYDNKPGADRYSFDNTLIVLRGLLEYEQRYGSENRKIAKAKYQGEKFLLKHGLFKVLGKNIPINKKWLLFSFPCYWFYDVLNSLDYFRESGNKDERLKDAIDLVIEKQNENGTWNLQNVHKGKVFFEMEKSGKPSRWNTLRCLRIIKWWEK